MSTHWYLRGFATVQLLLHCMISSGLATYREDSRWSVSLSTSSFGTLFRISCALRTKTLIVGGLKVQASSLQNKRAGPSSMDRSTLSLGAKSRKLGHHPSTKFSCGWLYGIDVWLLIVWWNGTCPIPTNARFVIKRTKPSNTCWLLVSLHASFCSESFHHLVSNMGCQA